MSDNDSNWTVNDSINAVANLANAVPIYPDLVQPAAQELGKSLQTVAKTVNIALAPLKLVVWWYEKIEEFISTTVSEKLKNVPPENIVEPPLLIAWPTAEALRFAGHDDNLRDLYANLLATAMDKDTISKAHPWFVEILKNITSDEAILLRLFVKLKQYPLIDIQAKFKDNTWYVIITSNYSNFSNLENFSAPELIPTYINNLCRLWLLMIPSLTSISEPNTYEPLENNPILNELKENIKNLPEREIWFERKLVKATDFWNLFIQNVVVSKS
jgi:hypothetical protein